MVEISQREVREVLAPLPFSFFFSTMWRSVSEMCVTPRLTALENLKFPKRNTASWRFSWEPLFIFGALKAVTPHGLKDTVMWFSVCSHPDLNVMRTPLTNPAPLGKSQRGVQGSPTPEREAKAFQHQTQVFKNKWRVWRLWNFHGNVGSGICLLYLELNTELETQTFHAVL